MAKTRSIRSRSSIGITRESVIEMAIELFKDLDALNADDLENLEERCMVILKATKKPEVATKNMITYLRGYADCLVDLGEVDKSDIEEDLDLIVENMESEKHTWEEVDHEEEYDDEEDDEEDY